MLGLAMPGVQNIVLQAGAWQALYEALPAPSQDLQPFLRDGEPDISEQSGRIDAALAVLRRELQRYQPEAVVVVCPAGVRDGLLPSFSLRLSSADSAAPPANGTEYRPRSLSFGRRLLDGLVASGFDLAWERAESTPAPAALDVCSKALALAPDMTVVPLLVNTDTAPMPTAARCLELGAALRDCLQRMPERVALVAAGGLSADDLGRWIDEPFDRWFLDRLTGDLTPLRKLFLFETEVLAGRTGELRTWLTVAAACSGSANLVDYLPSRQAKTGLAFVTWPGA